uniref:Translation initiation factor IF-2, chloroplastic n=1 Tax=Cryptomonas sp. SAG 977-2f TaxID=279061 RepID=A0A679CBJ7_9CRYP|nr:translation initiation factor 2 [Cryptomonas sp. SAG 977-2f]
MLSISSKSCLKLDKKIKKIEKDDEKENEKLETKPKSKKKVRSKLTLDEEYESIDFSFDNEKVNENITLLSLARPQKSECNAHTLLASSVKHLPDNATLAKKKNMPGSARSREEEPILLQKPDEVTLTAPITVGDLSNLLLVPKSDIIKFLFLKGIAITVNQKVGMKIAEIVSNEFGVKIVAPSSNVLNKFKKLNPCKETEGVLRRRPPIVTIMGHVDHGKTTLLDRIRHTQVASKEIGGITQKIDAYDVEITYGDEKRRIVFLDTPGHEAFSGMRSRGVSITDLAILVVAADDGIKQQTIEAIRYIKSAKVPLIVAINKIDKEDANLNFIQEELTKHNIIPEAWGGDTVVVPISAAQGTNINILLEMVLLLSDVLDLKANPTSLAEGVVLESYVDRAKGAAATLIVQNGTLSVGDTIVIGSIVTKVKGMLDSYGLNVTEVEPSTPVRIWGLPKMPFIGDRFHCFKNEKEAKLTVDPLNEEKKCGLPSFQQLQEVHSGIELDIKKIINLIIKTDTQGSAEAIHTSISKFHHPKVQLKILYATAGEVTETDIEFACTSNATLVAFNTTFASGARKAAKNVSIMIKEFDVIYSVFEYVQSAMDSLAGPQYEEELIGSAIVKVVFPLAKSFVAGSYVLNGKITKVSVVEILRNSEILYKGTITSLKIMKDDVSEVLQDSECGIFIDEFEAWKQGDIIKAFERTPKKNNAL